MLIARLMLQPADLLLLDEPTNDLDIPTLEVLEESLTEFPGALVLVTHDRFLLDRVSNVGAGARWPGRRRALRRLLAVGSGASSRARPSPRRNRRLPARPAAPAAKKKLSYLEAREWEQMESRILEAESELAALQAEMHAPDVVSDGLRLHEVYQKVQAAEARVAELYARWAELEGKFTLS